MRARASLVIVALLMLGCVRQPAPGLADVRDGSTMTTGGSALASPAGGLDVVGKQGANVVSNDGGSLIGQDGAGLTNPGTTGVKDAGGIKPVVTVPVPPAASSTPEPSPTPTPSPSPTERPHGTILDS